MNTAPAFAGAAVNVTAGLANATLDTSLTAPTNVTNLTSGGANGSKIEEIVVQAVGTTAAGVCNIFLYDGATYHLFDQFVITVVTSSTTAAAFRANRTYNNLFIPNGWSLRFTNTIAGNQSMLKVSAYGGDY